jgi:hypothetical protein
VSKRRTASEVWDILAVEAGQDEIEAAAAMTDAQVDEYLSANGFDGAELDAKADAFLDALAGRAAVREAASAAETAAVPAAGAIPLRPDDRRRRRPPIVWLAAAATVATAGAVGTYVALHEGKQSPDRAGPEPYVPPSTSTSAPPASANLVAARQLRQLAAERYADKDLVGAERYLDEARAFDPEGDEAPGVQELRRKLRPVKPELK